MKSPLHLLGFRDKHVCPWWCCFFFDNVLRRALHSPETILGPYVAPGDTILDVGPGMGYFTIPLARMVGEKGRVIAADVQPEMLRFLRRRAERAGVSHRVETHLCRPEALGIDVRVDFILAFWMVHEVPSQEDFFKELKSVLKPSGSLLVSEPKIHVSRAMFNKTLETVRVLGFSVKEEPKLRLSHSAVLTAG